MTATNYVVYLYKLIVWVRNHHYHYHPSAAEQATIRFIRLHRSLERLAIASADISTS